MIDFPKTDNQKSGAKTLKLKATTGYAYLSDKDVTIRIPWENVSKVAFKDLAMFVKTSAGFRRSQRNSRRGGKKRGNSQRFDRARFGGGQRGAVCRRKVMNRVEKMP